MKIRKGLVSNSSSSSYVLVVNEQAYNEVYEKLQPLEKDVAASLFCEEVILGQPRLVIGRWDDDNYSFWDWVKDDNVVQSEHKKDDDDIYLALRRIEKKIKEQPQDSWWTYEMDW